MNEKFGFAVRRGNPMRRLNEIEQRQRAEAAARRLPASTISANGIVIKENGNLDVEGGDVNLRDGGKMLLYYPSGNVGMYFGPLVLDSDGTGAGHGMLVQADADDPELRYDILLAKQDEAGRRVLHVGQNDKFLDEVDIRADVLILVPNETTTNAANARIDIVTGHLQFVTSTANSKLDIEPLVVDADALLTIEPKTWIDRGAAERGEATPRVAGFVVDELAAAGLEPLVDRNADHEAVGLQYERMSAYHHKVLQRHHAELAEQKAINAALIARLEALEAASGA